MKVLAVIHPEARQGDKGPNHKVYEYPDAFFKCHSQGIAPIRKTGDGSFDQLVILTGSEAAIEECCKVRDGEFCRVLTPEEAQVEGEDMSPEGEVITDERMVLIALRKMRENDFLTAQERRAIDPDNEEDGVRRAVGFDLSNWWDES